MLCAAAIRLITAVVRFDRFDEGAFDAAVRSGLVGALAARPREHQPAE
jgi:hypothetical protein